MAHVLYECPRTGMKVQTWIQDETSAPAPKTFELLRCPACSQLHFVDRNSGKLLGDRTK